MKLWWCMECQTEVELNRQGRCEVCDSESVDLLSTGGKLSSSVSTIRTESEPAPNRA
jgi:hypothetical protein